MCTLAALSPVEASHCECGRLVSIAAGGLTVTAGGMDVSDGVTIGTSLVLVSAGGMTVGGGRLVDVTIAGGVSAAGGLVVSDGGLSERVLVWPSLAASQFTTPASTPTPASPWLLLASK